MDNTIFLICNSVPHSSFTPPSLLTHSSLTSHSLTPPSLLAHSSLTSQLLLPHFSLTPPSLPTHSSLTSHSLLPHISLILHMQLDCHACEHIFIYHLSSHPTSPSSHTIPPFPPTITQPSHPFYKSVSPLCCVGLDM